MMAESLRLFFAIPLSESLKEAALGIQGALAEAGGDGMRVKWVEEDNLHLTLKFIGDTPTEGADRLIEVAKRVASHCRPASLQLHGVGCFPPRGAPRVIWIGAAKPSAELDELATRLDESVQAEGLAGPDRNPFTAHFTIGRVKDRQCGELASAIRRMTEEPVGEMVADHFCLISSELTPQGPIYRELARFELTE